MTADLIFAAANIVGESLVWDVNRQRLLWVDIIGKFIHALDPKTFDHQRWETDDFATSLGLRKDGGAVVAFTKKICLWNYDNQFHPLATVEPELSENRLNEGVIGPDGAFWVGTMQNNFAADGNPVEITKNTGRLYRCKADGSVNSISEDLFGITNTLIWTNTGHLITADTLKNELYRYDIDPATAQLTGRRIIVSGFERGLPDGSAMDADGYIWNCRVAGGGCIMRIDPDGKVDRVIELPCSCPTSCAFGGEDLSTLYITSARFTIDQKHLKANPQEGGLFAIKPGVSGLLDHRFG